MNAHRASPDVSRFHRSQIFFIAVALLGVSVLGEVRPVAAAAQEQQQEPPPQEAVARTPREIAELKADILMARKMYSDAIFSYEELLKNEPKNAGLMNKIGVCYSNLTKLDKAKKYYERAIKADRSNSAALNNLGTVHFYQRKFRRAIKVYQNAIKVRPDFATFHANLGHAWFADKKYPEAVVAWGHALELDPQVFERRGGVGGSILQTSSVEQRALFYFTMAKTYAGLGNAERCARFLKRAIEEGYKDSAKVEKDPAFASVIDDPQVKEALQTPLPAPAARPIT